MDDEEEEGGSDPGADDDDKEEEEDPLGALDDYEREQLINNTETVRTVLNKVHLSLPLPFLHGVRPVPHILFVNNSSPVMSKLDGTLHMIC